MERKRYNPDIEIGLTNEQVENQKRNNLINNNHEVPTKSIKQIIKENFITLFNILNLILGFLIFTTGSYKNMTFLLIAIINTAISTIQEIHSKRVIDKLSILAQSKAKVIRDSVKQEISIEEIVLDDILEFNTGDQIVTDSIIEEGEVEVDESFITGEPNAITKSKGEMLLSGSFIVSGKCIARVEHVGEENYTAQISKGAKYVKKVKSEIMYSLNKIIRILSIAIIPIGIILFWNQLQVPDTTIKEAILKSVAAIIGMIPEGLVLLTSTVLAVSVIRLSRRKVLVQELYCIETLARVDTLCLDKTGTLTEGKMEVKDIVAINKTKQEVSDILANIGKASTDNNQTIEAIRDYFKEPTKKLKANTKIPFSSKTKWSGITFENEGSYIMGAPEFILKEKYTEYQKQIEEYSKDYRVMCIVHTDEKLCKNELPQQIEVIGFIFITDKIRKEAKKTLQYFKKQGVDIKIISGDNPITVSKIASLVGVDNYEKYIDVSKLSEEELKEAAVKYTIFGRVTPIQKKILIKSLKENGRTVAMTGDGVNDVLALKESDCSIVMANGSDAAKNVAQLVLLDSNFDSMPKVVGEGRRTINNIERSASLFLTKTIYSSVMAIMFILLGQEYPFMPVQLSLISVCTIGFPSFVLALEPNNERIKGNFLRNVIKRSIPTALTVITGIFVISMLHTHEIINSEIYPSLCVIATAFSAILLLITMAKSRKSEHKKLPFSCFRVLVCIVVIAIFVLGSTLLSWWFNIVPLLSIKKEIIYIMLLSIINFVALNGILALITKIRNKMRKEN